MKSHATIGSRSSARLMQAPDAHGDASRSGKGDGGKWHEFWSGRGWRWLLSSLQAICAAMQSAKAYTPAA